MEDGTPINPRRALLELTKALPENAIISSDIGNVSSTANAYLKFNQTRRHIAALTFGNTGFAYPAALGAQLAEPDTAVRSEEHTSELQSRGHLVCRLLPEKEKRKG